jgi:hypothetical protein
MIADHSITNILCVVRFILKNKKKKTNIIIMVLFFFRVEYQIFGFEHIRKVAQRAP